ncbi:SpoIIE family protein phosphatase [Kineococcus sp. SYSU DK003]|uniref:SpoIIE family protein phosphatase n=1 Tax=Kineococcus sp. SYSU DK003 TaxID=3383124 RepID=UPI003D7D77BF
MPDTPRARLDLALEAAGLATFEYDLLDGTFTSDARLDALFGHPPDTSATGFQGRLAELVSAEDLVRFRTAVTDAIAGGGGFRLEFRVRAAAGAQPRWIGIRGRVLSRDGVPRRLLGVVHDATREHLVDLSSALESLPAAYYALDPDGSLRDLNAEAERLSGRSRAELLGRRWGEVFAAGSPVEGVLADVGRTGRAATVELEHPDPLGLWCELRAWPDGEGTSVLLLPTAARRAAEEAAARATTRVQVLARAGEHLAGTLDGETAVARLSGILVPALGDWCLVTVVDEHGTLRDVGWQHADPARQELLGTYAATRMRTILGRHPGGSSYMKQAIRSGGPVVLPEPAAQAFAEVLGPGAAADMVRDLDPEFAVVLPMRARSRTVGLVTLARDRGRRRFDAEDLATVSGVAERAALALDNARLYGQQQKIAEGLQRDLLTPPAQSPHWQTAVRYRPAAQAAQVGGDWYDAFHQPDGSTMLVIGDVVGHDIGAAAAMGQLRNLLRGVSFAAPDGPAGLLARLDAAIVGLGLPAMATALVGRLEPQPDGVFLEFSSAGHPSPVMLREGGIVVPLVVAERGADGREGPDLLLGVDATTQRHDGELLLRSGDTVLLHTDGLVERRDQSLDVGTARLLEAVARHADLGLEELCDALLDDLLPEHPEDDVALVAVRIA